MIGFLQFLAVGLIVVALSAIDPNNARWYALVFAGGLFMATLPIRRVQAGAEDPVPRKEARGTFED